MARAPIPTTDPRVRELLAAWHEMAARWRATWPAVEPLVEQYGRDAKDDGTLREQQWAALESLYLTILGGRVMGSYAGGLVVQVESGKPMWAESTPELTVRCPHCNARVGDHCETTGDANRILWDKFHKVRTEAAAIPPPPELQLVS